MKRNIYIHQIYESWMDYTEYPEGQKRTRLASSRRLTRAQADCLFLTVQPQVVDHYVYFRTGP